MENVYQVQEGDTWQSVAHDFQVLEADLYRLNPEKYGTPLVPGDTIVIPTVNTAPFQYYEVQKGDTLSAIAKKFYSTPQILGKLNNLEDLNYLFPGEKLIVPRPGVVAYITEPGDTLKSISDLYDIDPKEIIVYSSKIYLLPNQLIAFRIEDIHNSR